MLYFISWMVLSVLVARFVLAMRRGRLVREGTSLVLSTAVLGVVMVLGRLVLVLWFDRGEATPG